ncbi:MAG TPA: response regulator, partial [Caulobacteraceae bacterium]
AQQGVFYTVDSNGDEPRLKLLASYAYKERKHVDNVFKLGEGLVGQCALEKQKILLTNVPSDYIQITSGLGEATPLNVIVMPVVFEGQVKAVLELASFERFNSTHETFLDQLTESIGIVLNTIEANTRTEDLLKQSQSLAKELQSQQQELQQTNQELGEKAQLLAKQNTEVETKNQEVEQARRALEEKATQLALTSKYKSEFLANMSHELRTPLNSLLILSDQLAKNADENLTARQVEFSKTIHASGNDLLALINDILDLSKIESGTVVVDVGEIPFRSLQDYVERTFRHVAELKKLGFQLEFAGSLPGALRTDVKRLQQIIKNLLSNAFKFTDRGQVSFAISPAQSGWSPDHPQLNRAPLVVAFTVRDTGIGIPSDKQQIIFEAFQQADGSTSRRYGGTGLGLAISREIARMLGGEICLTSEPGEGSTFTLYLPIHYISTGQPRLSSPAASLYGEHPALLIDVEPEAQAPAEAAEALIQDDRDNLRNGDRILLIVENEPTFARYLLDMARERGFKAVVASRGSEALTLVHQLQPQAITLDINLPDVGGWRVLARLKEDTLTRHIPVQIITTEEEQGLGLKLGALGIISKPIRDRETLDRVFTRLNDHLNHTVRPVIVVGEEESHRAVVIDLVAGNDTTIRAVEGVHAAAELTKEQACALVIIVVQPGDIRPLSALEELRSDASLDVVPMIAYLTADPTPEQEELLTRLARCGAFKDVRSPARLVYEAALILHRNVQQLPTARRQMIEHLHDPKRTLACRKVLLVDDDIRNIFAMTSLLERHGMQVLTAETGRTALDTLEDSPDVEIVLMDIMMPTMDGYDTMRAIREIECFQGLPIIALTAKAMKGDREKCIEAGASDYISKPVDAEHLLSMLRLWLHR